MQRRQSHLPPSVVFQEDGHHLVVTLLQSHRQRRETVLAREKTGRSDGGSAVTVTWAQVWCVRRIADDRMTAIAKHAECERVMKSVKSFLEVGGCAFRCEINS